MKMNKESRMIEIDVEVLQKILQKLLGIMTPDQLNQANIWIDEFNLELKRFNNRMKYGA